eukprot:TRINITY_DN11723_c0_g6_i1.p2 TRINITY_DN11723_c0_g6~~TRINITY_DN11723_c0_g6_i1.p2  ORF type:complete len:439 (+),score=81.72 TRINITY_DN11723_c0_g6_i1:140-1456(+)
MMRLTLYNTIAVWLTIASTVQTGQTGYSSVCTDVETDHRLQHRFKEGYDLAKEVMHRPGFIPFGAVHTLNSSKLTHDETYTETSCQQALLADHYHDAYFFNNKTSTCWLLKTPLHRSAHLPAPESWGLSSDGEPAIVQVKPERINRVILQALTHFSTGESNQDYRLLNNVVDVTNVVRHCNRDSNGTGVIVLIADSSQSRFMRIWLHYWYQSGGLFSQVLFIAQDIEFYNLVEQLLPGQVLLEPSVLDGDFGAVGKAATFHSADFSKRVRRRYYQLSVLIAAGTSVLYSDIDVLLLCNPLRELVKCNKMRAPFDEKPWHICSGYIFVPQDDLDGMRVLYAADAAFLAAPTNNPLNQIYFNYATFLYPDALLPLHQDRFPSGKYMWKTILAKGFDVMEGKCYLHNNYARGGEKTNRLKQTGIINHTIEDDHPGFLAARA